MSPTRIRLKDRLSDTYRIVGPDGEISHKREAGQALSWAQTYVCARMSSISVLVERISRFGPVEPIYRVERDDEGIVRTHTITEPV